MFGGAHRIAVHRRQVGPWLVAQRRNIVGQPATDGRADCDRFGGQGARQGEQARLRLRDRQQAHAGRRQSPDLPPVLAIRRTSRMTIALSSALAMS